MLILGVDTSGKNGSIALVECGRQECQVVEVVALLGGTFSAQLIPQISELLRNHGFTKDQIGGFAIVSGPGSFTGLRVGLAAIKALAEILGKPVAAVSFLGALAARSGAQGRVIAGLDAGRGEIYAAEYDLSRDQLDLAWQELLTREEFVARSANSAVVTSDDSLAGLSSELKAIHIPPSRADVIAMLGYKNMLRGEIVSPDALDANYIRRSDAEIKNAAGSFRP
jgi:tRNA threonylcarbamoyladenosine biosynthesis protein TsaB